MKLKLIRERYLADGVFGNLHGADPSFPLVTCEHAYLQDDGTFKPKVKAGVYECGLRYSPRFKEELYEVKEVPGHTHILIHQGNYGTDSDGCILIGKALGRTLKLGFMITSSKQAHDIFMRVLDGQPFTLIIEDNV